MYFLERELFKIPVLLMFIRIIDYKGTRRKTDNQRIDTYKSYKKGGPTCISPPVRSCFFGFLIQHEKITGHHFGDIPCFTLAIVISAIHESAFYGNLSPLF